jgi:hypothetical protein
MLRSRFVRALLVVLMFSSVAVLHAQYTQYQNAGASYAFLDYPYTNGVNVADNAIDFEGWALDCSWHSPLDGVVELWRQDGSTFTKVPYTMGVVYRPDVNFAFGTSCIPAGDPYDIDTWTGWSITPTDPEPTGYHQYWLVFHGSSTVTLGIELNVVNH